MDKKDSTNLFDQIDAIMKAEYPNFGYIIVVFPPDKSLTVLMSSNMDNESVRNAGAILMKTKLNEGKDSTAVN